MCRDSRTTSSIVCNSRRTLGRTVGARCESSNAPRWLCANRHRPPFRAPLCHSPPSGPGDPRFVLVPGINPGWSIAHIQTFVDVRMHAVQETSSFVVPWQPRTAVCDALYGPNARSGTALVAKDVHFDQRLVPMLPISCGPNSSRKEKPCRCVVS